nr:putative RNA-dependent RNA polymerase [Rhizoctonia solani mitovirus 127]
MLMTIFSLATMLYLLRYFAMSKVIVALISQPMWVYAAIAAAALILRIAFFIIKVWPSLRKLVRSIMVWSDKQVSAGVKDVKSKTPFETNVQKRSYSTGPRKPGLQASVAQNKGVAKKSKKDSLYHSTLLRLNFSLDKIQDLFTVKGGRPLVNILKGISILAGSKASSGTIRFICIFIYTCKHIKRTQGIKGLTKFLKTASVSLQQSLGGHIVRDNGAISGARVSKTNGGLPRFIPAQIRIRVRANDTTMIRVLLTLLSIYRIFTFPGTLKLQTITGAFKGHDGLRKEVLSYIPLFMRLFVWSRFTPAYVWAKMSSWAETAGQPIFKGGPGVLGVLGQWNTHPLVLVRSLLALKSNPILWDSISVFLSKLPYTKIDFAIKQVFEGLKGVILLINGKQIEPISPLSYLGKLGTKEEAAGKIRVFAMVDAWTQWILYPIHRAIFMFLKDIPMDGTFDQKAPLAYVKAVRGLWSLDLSAATDRIPLSLQRALMGALFGCELTGAWANLLVGRAYRLHDKHGFTDLHYAVGQPMGALSSWASLAITHHFIVQVAAWRAGFPTWKLYTNYAVLGDDVVIGDYRVTTQYLSIMESFGVECGLHKSLLSHKGSAMEFAKKTIVNGVDVSPVAFKEFYAASRNLGAFIELTTKFNVPFARALQAFGVGWQVRSWLNKPLGKLSARIRLIILAMNIPRREEDVVPFFEMGQAPLRQFAVDSRVVIERFVETEVKRLKSKLFQFMNALQKMDNQSWGREWATQYLIELARVKDKSELKSVPNVVFIRNRLADIFTAMSQITWFSGRTALIKQASEAVDAIHKIKTNDFSVMYMEYLNLTQIESRLSLHTFAKIRPSTEQVRGLMTPSQVRIWKRWSQVLQGTKQPV